MNAIIPSLMIDIASTSLSQQEESLLSSPYVGGVILFARNVISAKQVRMLTDTIRTINPSLVIATDQEGGRVARLQEGFTPLPAMAKLGKLYQTNPKQALTLAHDVGYVMACEVQAVGIDISFAPVLDIDNGSLVIGDRAFCQTIDGASTLSCAFIDGMNHAGMGATGKHFPGHGSVVADSHVADAYDGRRFDDIFHGDMQVFVRNLDKLSALMPAHVVFGQVDNKPAGFSKIWLQDIVRHKLGFDGVLFSDDLSMKAAHVAGDVNARVHQALQAGCDVALICNDANGAKNVISQAQHLPQLTVNRLIRMKSNIPAWQSDLSSTCQSFAHYATKRERMLMLCASIST